MEKHTEKRTTGYGPSLIIGGKKYGHNEIASRVSNEIQEVHTVSGMENMPRQIHKELRNESGRMQTDINLQQGQEYGYDFNQRQQTGVPGRYSAGPVYSSYNSPYENELYNKSYNQYYDNSHQRIHTENIVTSSQLESDSRNYVREHNLHQTNYNVEKYVYQSSNAEAGQTAAQSLGMEVSGRVEAIHTMQNPVESSYENVLYSNPQNAVKYSNLNIETTSSREAMSVERMREIIRPENYRDDLIYRSSNVEAGQTVAQSLGMEVDGRVDAICTMQNPVESSYENVLYSNPQNAVKYSNLNIETTSSREAVSVERLREILSPENYRDDLIYRSSNAEAGQTVAQSLGMEVDGRVDTVHTILNPVESYYISQNNKNKTAVKSNNINIKTGSSMKADAEQRVTSQGQILAESLTRTSYTLQGIMTGGTQMTSPMKMLDAINQNRGGDEEESFEESMMPTLKSGIKAGILLSGVSGVSNYLQAASENPGMLTGESDNSQFMSSVSWLNPKRSGDYIRSMSSKNKGGITFRGITMDKSKVMTGNVELISKTSNLESSMLGGGLSIWKNLLQKRTVNTGINSSVNTGRTIQTAIGSGTTGMAGLTGIAGLWNPLAGMWKNSWLTRLTGTKSKLISFITEPGESPTTSFLDVFKMIGIVALIPLLLIVIAFGAGSSAVSVPVMAASSFFGGIFELFNPSGSSTELDIREFLSNDSYGIPALRDDYITDLVTELEGYKDDDNDYDIEEDDYDIVRLKVDDNESFTSITYDAISAEFYTEAELTNMIQPIFTAYLLMEYNFQPMEQQAKDALSDIFDQLVVKTVTDGTTEHCGQDLATGIGEAIINDGCNSVHAYDNCPNSKETTHTSYTCSSCCHYDPCPGHQQGHNDECEEDCQENHISYCVSNCIFDCNGHNVCEGHSVKNIHLSMDGIYLLMEEYFLEPIRSLESAGNLSDEQKERLQLLKDCLELCEELIVQVYSMYGLEMTKADLQAVEMIPGTRTDGEKIIQIAMTQVGYAGGYRYWNFMGYSERVEWCACFVSWCMNKVEHGEVRYASCEYGGVPYFQGIGRFVDGNHTDLAKGDVIFFDWDADGTADHTGLVAGKDANYVYTIEGNSSDMVKIKKYQLGHSQIHGYGLMYY